MTSAQQPQNPQQKGESTRALPNEPKRSIGELISSIVAEVGGVVRREIELAKAELTTAAIKGGIGAGGFIVAAVFLYFALIMLLFAGAYGLVAAGLPSWAAFLIIAGGLIVLAIVVAIVGYIFFKKVRGPERTIATMQNTVLAVQGKSVTPVSGKSAEYNEIYKNLYGTDAR